MLDLVVLKQVAVDNQLDVDIKPRQKEKKPEPVQEKEKEPEPVQKKEKEPEPVQEPSFRYEGGHLMFYD